MMINGEGPVLALSGVRFGFRDRPDFLGPISMAVQRGQAWGLVGPNGAGKSTLLRLMAGLLEPSDGSAALLGRNLRATGARERAKALAFVPQNPLCDLDLPVRDVVLLGRYPHRAFGVFESAEDLHAAERVMELTDTLRFADRPLRTLSVGEAQRVHAAAALAQQPQILLLDEPTVSLDLRHQLAVFGLLRELVQQDHLAIVVVTHDINLAGQFCDRVLLLDDGKAVAAGLPEEVLTPRVLEPVYGVEMAEVDLADAEGRRWLIALEVAGRT